MIDQVPVRVNPLSPGRLFAIPRRDAVSRHLAAYSEELKTLGIAALINALLFGSFFLVATPGYETNDDRAMQLIASGFYTGQPSAHIVFTHIWIGWVLRGLYELWSGPNWYFLYLVMVHFVALTALAFVILSRNRNWKFVLLYAGFFLLAETRILLELQFTTTAFLAGAAGVMLLVDGLEPGRPVRWFRTIAGVTFITLMGMIRLKVAPFMLIVAFPFLLERFGLHGLRRLAGAGLVCLVLFLTMHEVNQRLYDRNQGWAKYLEYNRLRGQVQLTWLESFVSRATAVMGWSENDAEMFEQYYFPEASVYGNVTQMRRFVAKLKSFDRPGFKFGRFSPDGLCLPMVWSHDSSNLMSLALLSVAWCLFAAGRSRCRCGITLTVMYFVFVLVSFYLWCNTRLPARVTYNMPLFMILACLYWATTFHKTPAKNRVKHAPNSLFSVLRRQSVLGWIILYVLLLFKVSENLWYANAYHRSLKRISQRIFDPIRTMLPTDTKPILIPMPLNPTLCQCLMYRSSPTQAPFYLVPGGWLTFSPIFQEVLHQHRLEPYSLSLLNRRDVFFLMRSGWFKPLRKFYREHYDLDIHFQQVLNTDDMPKYRDCHLQIYRILCGGNGPPSVTVH